MSIISHWCMIDSQNDPINLPLLPSPKSIQVRSIQLGSPESGSLSGSILLLMCNLLQRQGPLATVSSSLSLSLTPQAEAPHHRSRRQSRSSNPETGDVDHRRLPLLHAAVCVCSTRPPLSLLPRLTLSVRSGSYCCCNRLPVRLHHLARYW